MSRGQAPERLRAAWAPPCGRAGSPPAATALLGGALPGPPRPSRRRGPERESAGRVLSDPLSLLLLGEPAARSAAMAGNCISKGDEGFGAGRPCASCGGRGVSAERTGPDGGGGFPQSPHPPCRPATCPRKVGVTLTSGEGEARGEPRGAAGAGVPPGLGGGHRVVRRSAVHWSPGIFRLWVLFYSHTIFF